MTSPLRDAESATAGVPVVRGLAWEADDHRSMHCAGSALGVYCAWEITGTGVWARPDAPSGTLCGTTLDHAKAAAQADYEQRILSALNPDFLSELDTARAEIERLRERIQTEIDKRLAEDAALVAAKRGMAPRRLDILNEVNLLKSLATLSPVKENDRERAAKGGDGVGNYNDGREDSQP